MTTCSTQVAIWCPQMPVKGSDFESKKNSSMSPSSVNRTRRAPLFLPRDGVLPPASSIPALGLHVLLLCAFMFPLGWGPTLDLLPPVNYEAPFL